MTKLLRILFVVLFASVWKVGGAQTVETIWEEDWSTGTADQPVADYNSIYSCGNAGTKIVTGTIAGGATPELVVAKGDVFSVSLTDLKGCTKFSLSFNTNRSAITVKANDEVVKYTYSNNSATATFSLADGTTSLDLSFTLAASPMRLDNFKLTGTKVTPTAVSFGEDFDISKTYTFVDGEIADFVAPTATCDPKDAKGHMQYTTTKPNMVTIDESTGLFTFTNKVYGYAKIRAQWIGSDGYANSNIVEYQVENRKSLVFSESDKDAANDIQKYDRANVTLNRKLYADGWNTFCVPFDIKNLTTRFGEGTKLMEFGSEEGNVLYFKEATEVKAGYPYLIMPGKDGTEYQFNGVGVVDTDPMAVGGTIKFKGLYHEKDITADGNVAGLASNNRIVKVQGDGTTKAFRAYFVLPQSQNAANYVLNIDGTTTAIDNVYVGGEKASAPVYNLQGQRVNATTSLPSGIYVQNGRKFVVK